jgi:hypothetical protein
MNKEGMKTLRKIKIKSKQLIGKGELKETSWYTKSETRKKNLTPVAEVGTRIEYVSSTDFEVGDEVVGQWVDNNWYNAEIVAVNEDGSYHVIFDDDGEELDLVSSQLYARGEDPLASHEESWESE